MIKGELFSTEMVQAYLEKRKLHTCRPILKDAEVHECADGIMVTRPKKYPGEYCRFAPLEPKYQPGDFMYCRETWLLADGCAGEQYYYKADIKAPSESEDLRKTYGYKWHPSIHMPKEAARLFFKVPKVAIMNLDDVDEQFAVDDGFQPEYHGWTPTFNDPDSGGDGNDQIISALDKFKEFWGATYGSDAKWMWVYWTDPVSREEAGDAHER